MKITEAKIRIDSRQNLNRDEDKTNLPDEKDTGQELGSFISEENAKQAEDEKEKFKNNHHASQAYLISKLNTDNSICEICETTDNQSTDAEAFSQFFKT